MRKTRETLIKTMKQAIEIKFGMIKTENDQKIISLLTAGIITLVTTLYLDDAITKDEYDDYMNKI